MKKRLLTIDEMKTLFGLMRKAFAFVNHLRSTDCLADCIQYPKVPSILSESLVVHLINRARLVANSAGPHARLGGKVADILFQRGPANQQKIEVKASAREGFSEFALKDTCANYLVWVHFGTCFLADGSVPIEVYVVERPGDFFSGRVKISLPEFRKRVGNNSSTCRCLWILCSVGKQPRTNRFSRRAI